MTLYERLHGYPPATSGGDRGRSLLRRMQEARRLQRLDWRPLERETVQVRDERARIVEVLT